jgi:26S proteasome regulatory subunit N9
MSLDEIRKLQGERKWLQFCNAIILACGSESIDELLSLYAAALPNIHPQSLTKVSLRLAEALDADRAIELLEATQNAVRNSVMYGEAFDTETTTLEIRRLLFLVEKNELSGVERRLYEWKHLEMEEITKSMYCFLGYKFYEKIGNVEGAFDHLFLYAKLNPDANVIDELLRYALLSREFYNFNSVAVLPNFESSRSKELKKLFLLFKDGDTNGLSKCSSDLERLFGDSAEMVREKIYIIGLLNICFSEPEKMVHFSRIEGELGISGEMATYVVLKSLGLGLIDGWINGENRILYFNGIVPRVLKAEEIERMKMKFESWRKRVEEVVKTL